MTSSGVTGLNAGIQAGPGFGGGHIEKRQQDACDLVRQGSSDFPRFRRSRPLWLKAPPHQSAARRLHSRSKKGFSQDETDEAVS